MKKKLFKKIFVEITNRCNLHCSFCGENTRSFRDMTLEEFRLVLSKIRPYTDYIYLHVKGEPLLRSDLDYFLDACDDASLQVNLTTNGVFLSKRKDILLKHPSIRQINISLHAEQNVENYFEQVFTTVEELSQKMYVSYRIWNLKDGVHNEKSTAIVDKIVRFYQLSSEVVQKIHKEKSVLIAPNIYLNQDSLFVWPTYSNSISCNGYCYGLTSHIGILSDGTVVPCCLDGNGEIPLGNIFSSDLESILSSPLSLSLKKGFQNHQAVHPLCRHCNFRNRFQKK